MGLKKASVSKCLDRKLQFAGFEIADILIILTLLSILKFLFGNSGHETFLVWLPVASLIAILRIGKRGKPENFILHWFKYQTSPKAYYAFHEPTKELPVRIRRFHGLQ